jgi:putative protease
MPGFELLAPAKDLACGLAAIECGADAVYIGAERFSARRGAANPRADIAQLVARAHLFHARVYAAVNTILSDEELEPARRLIAGLYEDGVDAVIVQDFGLLEMALPPIALIASTQMHNHSPQRVRFLREVGFSRAILARELSLPEISAISAAAPGLELEAFVHGALCVSYSGRCHLSYAWGGRSANRGECAQPCRKPYLVKDRAGKVLAQGHALSLKDLDLRAHLGALMRAGVTSFKIEGRLKDAAYVQNTVLAYSRALDAVLAQTGGRRASRGEVRTDFLPDLAKTFNRGSTTYFLQGRDPGMHSHGTAGFLGEPVGKALWVRGDRVGLDKPAGLHAGDGLAFFDAQGRLCGTALNGVQGAVVQVDKPAGIAAGTRLFRNFDRLWHKALAAARIERKLALALELRHTDTGLELRVQDEDGVHSSVQVECAKSPPQDAVRARRNMESQLSKLGATAFYVRELVLPEHPDFVPLAVLNQLRRDAVSAHVAARIAAHERGRRQPEPPGAVYPEAELGPEANVSNRKAEAFLLRHGARSVARAWESAAAPMGTRVMTCRYCLRHALGKCGPGPDRDPLWLEDEAGARLRLEFDCRACRMAVYTDPG